MNQNILIGTLIMVIIFMSAFYYYQQNPEKLESIPFTYYELNELVISTVLFIIILVIMRLKLLDSNVANTKIVSYINVLAPAYFFFYFFSKLIINIINSDKPLHNSDELILLKNL